MTRPDAELDPELSTLLKLREVERRLRPEVRARVLARCWASVLGGEAFVPAPPPAGRRALPVRVQRGRRLAPLVLAASIAIVAGAVGALAALRARATHDPPLAVPTVVPDDALPDPAPEAPTVTISRADTAKLARTPRAADRFTAEDALLRRAHIAYARHDFSVALALVEEHRRRFPKGPLAEEREALRVESLVGAGLTEDARRRAAVFAARFPRSVLLPRVEAASRGVE
jgi:hypothetical protein